MRVRLIHVTTKRSGAVARREEVVEAESIGIGRGTDNPIQIPGLTVSLHHAALVASGGGVFVERRDAPEIAVNGAPVAGARLSPGDVVRVGGWELRALEPESGEQLAFEIVEVAHAAGEADDLARRTRIGVERGWFTRRKLSWAATIGILLVFGALPVWLRRATPPPAPSPIGRSGMAGAVGVAQPSGVLRVLDASWNVGTVSAPHRPIADRCEACHAVPFEPIPSRQCTTVGCHADVGAHAPDEAAIAGLADARCTSCHKEHEGDARLILGGDRLCTGCHGSLKTLLPGTSLGDVLDFASAHPELRPTVLVELGSTERRRVTLGSPEARELSGLKFPHDRHLKPDLRGPDGPTKLECASCHHLDASGAMQEKVEFARDCQRCHRLSFIDAEPAREVPHASPDVVRDAVFEAFAARALRDLPEDPMRPGDGRRWRRPGPSSLDRQREAALASARRQSDLATGLLLGPDGPCADCHVVQGDVETLEVVPVRVVPLDRGDRWLPLSRFSHAPHMRVPCTDCHAAETASSSEVVLMPGIEDCRACHAGEAGESGKLASGCLTCHGFHHPELGPMRGDGDRHAALAAPLRAGGWR